MAHGFAGADRFQRIGAGQNGREFLAAEARDQPGAIAVGLGRGGKQLEHAIAQFVAEAIVGLFEMIEIEDQHRDRIGPSGRSPG